MTPTILRDDDPHVPAAVRDALETGQTIIFPTDTIYGMGGNPWDDSVLTKIRELKGRTPDQPFTLHLATVTEVDRYAQGRPGVRPALAKLLPGPFTVILPPLAAAPPCSVSPLGVGLRVPDHRFFSLVLAPLGRPLFGTSVNEHGEDPILEVGDMIDRFPSVDLVILGAVSGVPSAIIDLTAAAPRAVRGRLPSSLWTTAEDA
jgi:L-threonylcarbamoyladenylate synthase